MKYLGFLAAVLAASGPVLGAVTPTRSEPRASSGTTTSMKPRQAGTCSDDRTAFTYFGVNESGAEFGNQNIPGVLGTDYIWPAPSSIDYFVNQGFNFFRVPFQQERLVPPATGLTGPFDQAYFSDLQETVSYIIGKGAFVAIEPHNFLIYNGATITSSSDFSTFWVNLATEFADNPNVIFDLMNEPHDVDASIVYGLMQDSVNAIRDAGLTQLILVEGTSWTGAHSWITSGNAAAFAALTDPLNNTLIQMHQYLDSDSSGTSSTCVSATIGSERLADATAWLQEHNFKGILGEIGAGNNAQCISAIYDAMCFMQESGAWVGAAWWAAGPWWGNYFQSIEPPSGPSVSQVLPQALLPFL